MRPWCSANSETHHTVLLWLLRPSEPCTGWKWRANLLATACFCLAFRHAANGVRACLQDIAGAVFERRVRIIGFAIFLKPNAPLNRAAASAWAHLQWAQAHGLVRGNAKIDRIEILFLEFKRTGLIIRNPPEVLIFVLLHFLLKK